MKKTNRILLFAVLAALASISMRAQTTGTTTGSTTGTTTGSTTGSTTGATTGNTTTSGTTIGGTTTGGTATGGTTTVGTTTAGTTTGGTTTVGSTTGGSTTAGKTTSATTAEPDGGKGNAKGKSGKKGPNEHASARAQEVHAVIEAFQAQRATYLAARKQALDNLKVAPEAEKARILAEIRLEKQAREEEERSLGKQIREDLKKLRDDRKGGAE
jgi:hypothetical protein